MGVTMTGAVGAVGSTSGPVPEGPEGPRLTEVDELEDTASRTNPESGVAISGGGEVALWT